MQKNETAWFCVSFLLYNYKKRGGRMVNKNNVDNEVIELDHYENPIIQDAGNCGIYASLNGFKMLKEEKVNKIGIKIDIFNLVKKVSYATNKDTGITFIGEFFDGENLCKLINDENFKKVVSKYFPSIESFNAKIVDLDKSIFEQNNLKHFYLIPIHLRIKNDNMHWITIYNNKRANSINGCEKRTHRSKYLTYGEIKEENSSITDFLIGINIILQIFVIKNFIKSTKITFLVRVLSMMGKKITEM